MRKIVFFNNKGGVGKTSLVYHLAWMYADLGRRILAVDLDPQANLTSMFLDEESLEILWDNGSDDQTIYTAIEPRIKGLGDIQTFSPRTISSNIGLIPGDLRLSSFEADLSSDWYGCADKKESAFRTESAFHRIIEAAIGAFEADLVLIDVGPNLGAINRSAMITAADVVVPLAPDLFSLQGLKNLGPTLSEWREQWQDRKQKTHSDDLSLPNAEMRPIGYVLAKYNTMNKRHLKYYERWMARIPNIYRKSVLQEWSISEIPEKIEQDPHCLAILKDYHSLMPMAMEARKPMFLLKPADGVIGAHVESVSNCYKDFRKLANAIDSKG